MGKKDFFLEPDDAQTMGDINYMRKPKKIRRTFPKTLANPDGFAIERSVSSEGENNFSEPENGFEAKSVPNNYPQKNFNTAPVTERSPKAEPSSFSTPASNPAPKSTPASEPRKPDDSMDMFRNMAKNIRKRR